jgi:hypothetical protein
MNEHERADQRLTTADVAEAGSRSAPDPPADTRSPEREVTRVERMQADAPAPDAQPTSLLAADETKDFRARWDAIQTGFVDEPRQAVEQADALVASAIKRLAEVFADERSALEQQWDRGDDVSTEDLRIAMRRYRFFFDRLLSV